MVQALSFDAMWTQQPCVRGPRVIRVNAIVVRYAIGVVVVAVDPQPLAEAHQSWHLVAEVTFS